MKPRFLATAIAVLLITGGCSKKGGNNSSTPVGTFQFTTNDKVYNWTAVADTIGFSTITAVGIMPGSTDSGQVILVLSSPNSSLANRGIFSDTADLNNGQDLYPSLWTSSGGQYRDASPNTAEPSVQYPWEIDITSNNGSVASGTFSGMFYNAYNGVGDSILMTKGIFSVKL